MERFRPIIKQSINFVDPLSAASLEDNDNNLEATEASKDFEDSTGHVCTSEENYFGEKKPKKLLGASLNYSDEWDEIYNCSREDLCSLGLNGELRACRLRSLCWQIYLGVLPDDCKEWQGALRKQRDKYETVRLGVLTNPGLGDDSLDPLLNNPLSQDEESPWNRYFEDSQLKQMIRQDVIRTFPEVEFFQSPRIRDMMVTILFCFAREYPHISYKQGMHEILAPLIFVIHCDHQAHQHAYEMKPTSDLLQELMDEVYLEHDAYIMFEAVMKELELWYVVPDLNQSQHSIRHSIINARPFAQPQDIGPTNVLVQKLTSIHDNQVKRFEPDIYTHLTKLEIPPQIYGIRWLRLLFGREFPLQDLLVVWDAIFADGKSFPLVDFLTVAMLSYIREPILNGDYTSCLNYLMRYPAAADVHYIVQVALHLRNPKKFHRPPGYSANVAKHKPTVGGQPDVHRAPRPTSANQGSGSCRRSSSVSVSSHSNSESQLQSMPSSKDHSVTRTRHYSIEDRGKKSKLSNGTEAITPTVSIESDPLQVVSFTTTNSGSGVTGEVGSQNPASSRASKVMSGLARLGEKIARPKELPVSRPQSLQSPPTPSPSTELFVSSQDRKSELSPLPRSMNELTVVRTKTSPIETAGNETMIRHYIEGRPRAYQSSDEDDDDVAGKSGGDLSSSESLSVDDLAAVCLGCAMKLSHHSASLQMRLYQLNIENDITIRNSVEGIKEIVDTLTNIKSPGNRRRYPDPRRKEQVESLCDPMCSARLSDPLSIGDPIL
ncbi:TBC1 domain family member 5 isoform X2 [Oratosquilla oratoria]|uniref:TBC1 domain family member 5 isoform X2 n=1 Tax=Oratosquilla oratoria TaxID=337810 RepID=UPI003F75EC7E